MDKVMGVTIAKLLKEIRRLIQWLGVLVVFGCLGSFRSLKYLTK